MIKINNLYPFESQIKYIESKIPVEKIKQYKHIFEKNREYPGIHSNNQFKFILDSYKNEQNIDIYERLLKLITIVCKRKNYKNMEKLFQENKSDKEYYENIKKFMNESKFNKQDTFISQPKFIYYNLDKKIKSILDIGCGDGKKAEELGKLFGLQKENIICADIEKWFSYNNKLRASKNVTLMKINEKGNINIPGKYDLITILHVIHHWCYDKVEEYIQRLKSIHNLLNPDGTLVIMEHDCLTSCDYALADIEHGLWEVVVDKNPEGYYKDFKARYLNAIEIQMLMKEAGFKLEKYLYYNRGDILETMLPTKSYIAFFSKN